jgi:hypothetical protein
MKYLKTNKQRVNHYKIKNQQKINKKKEKKINKKKEKNNSFFS